MQDQPGPNANQRQPISGSARAVTQASKCTDVGTGAGLDPLADDSPGGESAGGRQAALLRLRQDDEEAVQTTGQTFDIARRARWTRSPTREKANAEVIEVPAGVLVLREQKAERRTIRRSGPLVGHPGPSGPVGHGHQEPGAELRHRRSATSRSSRSTSRTRAARRSRRSRGTSPSAAPTTRSAATRSQTSQHFAIALDNELVSAPYINWRENPDGIDGSTGAQISGSFTIQSAQDLAKILKIGALPLKLTEVSRSQVSATLGKQALDQGLKAGIAGFIIVALFLIIFYRVLGVIATLALCIYALYFYALVKLIPITLTLPGIAGLILTLGVAADANIVVFERVKEEVRAGRSVGTAIVTGYRKGLTAIIDANIVTFLVAFILFIIATAGVQGFAFTLGLGVIVSLFTAVLATQAILYSLRGTRLIRSKAALGAGEQRIKFQHRLHGQGEVVLLAVGLHPARLRAGDVRQGHQLRHRLRRRHAHHRVAASSRPRSIRCATTMAPLGLADAKIQTLTNADLGKNVVQISTKELGPRGVNAVNKALAAKFGDARRPERRVDRPELR